MKAQLKKLSSGFLVFLMSTMAGVSAHADDTEIFFSTLIASEVQPNVLFILDNSRSMSDGSPAKIDQMKSAMRTLLQGMNNVNVGLMQFSYPGAAVIYPVTDIDAYLPYPVPLTYNITAGTNDVEEATATGTITTDNTRLSLTERSSSGTNTLSTQVIASEDDAEELISTGIINRINSPSLELPIDDFGIDTVNEHVVGTIFRNQTIPQGAVIVSAYLEFAIEEGNSNNKELNLEIRGQLAGSSTVESFSDSNNISGRTRTSNSKVWSLSGTTTQGTIETSPNLVAIVQEIVDQADWTSGNDIALLMRRSDSSEGARVFASFDNTKSLPSPKLTVVYEDEDSTKTQIVGLRYENVRIPQGATVTSATLSVTSASEHTNSVTYSIYGDSSADSLVANDFDNLSSRSTTASTVTWTPGTWETGQSYTSPNLSGVLQDIVSNGSWCGGDALTLMISNGGDGRFISAYEDSPSSAPTLTVTYDASNIALGGGCTSSEVSYRITDSGDNDGDGEAFGNNGRNILSSDYIVLGDETEPRLAGFRFQNIQLPQGAIVQNAYLEFTAYGDDSSAAEFTIRAEDSDNAPASGTANADDFNDKSYDSATVTWANVPAWSTNMNYRTPDITSLVQPIVNKSNWTSGNAIFFALDGTGLRRASSYEANAATAARLVISYEDSTAGGTTTPMRTVLTSMVDSIQASAYTPIVDSLYEAALYYRGDAMAWGDKRRHESYDSSYTRYLRVSHEDSYTGGTVSWPSGCSSSDLNDTDCAAQEITGSPTYISPITNQCQSNHIVFLTDGRPSQNASEDLIESKFGITCDPGTIHDTRVSGDKDQCALQLAQILANNDQLSPNPSGDQTVKTHVIGFGLSSDADATTFLNNLAQAGGTQSAKSASDAASLLDAFESIVENILALDTTFVSPGVTVNTFNRLTHRNEIYYALFKPESTPSWPGNLKRYAINSSGTILDVLGNDAIDSNTGFFKDTARSWWSTSADGANADQGAAAANLPSSSSRDIYTYYSGSTSITLSNTANAFNTTNVSKTMLGIGSETDAYHQNLISWARGADPSNSGAERKRLADPLHSVPHLVTYGGTDANPDLTIFYGDNEGFFHAINAETGVEEFAFIPEELLPNLNTVYTNDQADSHPYGIDGPVNAWVYDMNGDNQIVEADGDHVYVYFGMRRGGRSYYALDVTDRSRPKYLWRIQGGTGDFTELGQTWSKPVKTKINLSGNIKDVLIFSGGYDEDQDNVTVTTADDVGRAIYIVDAETGQKLWSAGPSGATENFTDMRYSIPGNVRVLDMNGDGLADQMYAGDVGGQLWRFDIENGSSAAGLVTGAVIADISGSGQANARRFYHEPDVSVIIENNTRKLAISIGSGYRAHPLSTVTNDRMYMFKQEDVFDAPDDGPDSGTYPDYVKIDESDLYDATQNLVQSSDSNTQRTALSALEAASGWYINLEANGEKMISTPLAVSGQLFFTTYSPETNTASCQPSNGTSRLYSVNVLDAGAVNTSNNNSSSVDKRERFETLMTVGIPADPVRLRISDTNGTKDVLCVGTECDPISSGQALTRTYWYTE